MLACQLPVLPPELQYAIFEKAAQSGGPSVTLKLMLVARHVHDWIKPFLYPFISQISSPRFPDFESYPGVKLEDVGPLARHLLIGGAKTVEEIKEIILLCRNIYDLAVWTQHPFCDIFPVLQHLSNLRRLSASLNTLSEEEILSAPMRYLTHLDVVRFKGVCWKDWSVMSKLSSLTHMAINTPVELEVIQNLLTHCDGLQILLVMQDSEESWLRAAPFLKDVANTQDHRLVLIDVIKDIDVIQDWENGARGELDSWTFAELLSYARRSEFLLDNSQKWVSRPYPWTSSLNAQGQEWFSSLGYD